MKEALSDILNSYNGMVSDVLISRYIQGKANTDEIRHIEHLMLEDPFLADAIEGLKEGAWDLHDQHITELKKNFAKPKPNAFKLSVASVAVAASVVLITYFGFNGSMFKKAEEAASDAQMSAEQKVEKHTHVSVLKESSDTVMGNKGETDISLLRIQQSPKGAPETLAADSVSVSNSQTRNLVSLNNNAVNGGAPAVEKEIEEEYISKDKNFDRKRAVIEDDDVELSSDGVAEPVMSNTSAAPAAKQKSDLFSAKGSHFVLLAQNTKSEIFNLEEVEYKKEKSKAVPKKILKSTAKCKNCPDKEEIAEANAIGDTIASNKATTLYEQGAYAEAAKWYYRQPDIESKIMAGLSYLQASDPSSCKMVEQVLGKVNVNASNYLKALRLYYEGSEDQSLMIFQKLIDNNSKYKYLAEKNKQVISTK